MSEKKFMKVALAQLSPVWLNKSKTLEKIYTAVEEAADEHCSLVVFGEAFLPGYPFWLELTGGATFNSVIQKEIFAHYASESIDIDAGDLDHLKALAKEKEIAIYLGCIERPRERGGHSLYCSLVYIDKNGQVKSVHRKLCPTYEERLVWSPGDGHGLQAHSLEAFTIGGLNCWENWMPLSRVALYGQGVNVHVAVWPGSVRNTIDITRMIALESRSYVISVGSLMHRAHLVGDIPHIDKMKENAPEELTDGGSCIAAPNGKWLIEPQKNKEGLLFAELDYNRILEERQNFDPVGHYSRPDVTRLYVNRERQSILSDDG